MEKGTFTIHNQNHCSTAIQKWVSYEKVSSTMRTAFFSFQTAVTVKNKNSFFGHNRWLNSKKAKSLIVLAIIAVMLISIFAFLPKQDESKAIVPQATDNPTAMATATPSVTATPSKSGGSVLSSLGQFINSMVGIAPTPVPTPKPPGVLASAQTINSTVWRAVAANAWAYFQPDIGVDSTTGLPFATAPVFTDWDLGAYIQAVIDAQKIGLISNQSDWSFNARMDKVLTFLETRPLNATTNYPYQFYQSTDGQDDHADSDQSTQPIDLIDTGRLFDALNNLKTYDANLTSRINNFVYNVYGNRTNYAALVPHIKSDVLTDNSIYAYYCWSGFASFWPNNLTNVQSTILNNIFSAGNVTALGNVSLPKATITGDPLFCSVFELNNTDPRLMALANQVFSASEAYYNVTGYYRAFGEGPNFTGGWEWEWVVLPNGQTWILDTADSNSSPIAYTKIAMSFLAIYNTTYSQNLSIFLENTLPTPNNGYFEGVDDAGEALMIIGDLTNSLILDAALYAIQTGP